MKKFVALGFAVLILGHTLPVLAQDSASQRAQMGFILKEETSSFRRYSFREQGEFLISKQAFSLRKAAFDFCQSHKGFELSTLTLPAVMGMAGLPFPEIESSCIVKEKVLSGEGYGFGVLRSGLIFWAKGENADEEKKLSVGPDVAIEFRDGCGDLCSFAEPLSTINKRLADLGKPTRTIPAICVDEKLKKAFANE